MKNASSLFLFSLILMIGGCVSRPQFYYNRVEGTVREKGTAATPIAGAVVLVRWNVAFGTHSGGRTCTWIETAETDAQGRFSILVESTNLINRNNSFKREMKGGHPEVFIFKSGMVTAGSRFDDDYVSTTNNSSVMQKSESSFFHSSPEVFITTVVDGMLHKSTMDSHDRIRQLYKRSEPQSYCADHVGPGQAKRYYEAIANEANTIASNAYEKALADLITQHAHSPIGPNSPFLNRTDLPIIDFDPNIGNDNRDERDHTPLMSAVYQSNPSKVDQLLRAGAEPNRTTFNHQTALTLAIERYGYRQYAKPADADNRFLVIKTLLSNPATDPGGRSPGFGRRELPLMDAVTRGQDDVVSLLLQLGADPTIKVDGEKSALEHAAMEMKMNHEGGQASYIRSHGLIRQADRDPHQKERSFMRAVRFGDVDSVRRLIREGVDPNAGGDGTRTALIFATQNALIHRRPNFVEVVYVIASTRGVNKASKHDGQTAFQMAQSAGRSDLMETLR
ncbi:MAG: ankyrin repeat domain-containing protein [Pseudomonadota bacterium]